VRVINTIEKGPWYRYDFSEKSDHLIIGFGSIRMFNRQKKRGFEWDNLLKYKFGHLKFNSLFVGDVNNSWWHTDYEGLPGYGPLVLRDFLLRKIKESGATKTLCLGVSMGGYGAILFGCLTGATQTMSFSPQTNLSEGRRRRSLSRKFDGFDVDERFTDLQRVLLEQNNNKTIYKIWYGSLNGNDKNAANRISKDKNVFIYPVKTRKHNPIKLVLKSGVFKKEIESFIRG